MIVRENPCAINNTARFRMAVIALKLLTLKTNTMIGVGSATYEDGLCAAYQANGSVISTKESGWTWHHDPLRNSPSHFCGAKA